MVRVSDGVLWARIRLPFRLDHLNLYLVEDYGGWTAIDAGARSPICIEDWDALMRGPLAGTRVTRLIGTHFHPDHIGLAGWLCDRHDAAFWTTSACLGTMRNLCGAPADPRVEEFYVQAGMEPARARSTPSNTSTYSMHVGALPGEATLVEPATDISIGGRDFRAVFGHGHADDQLMLWSADLALLLAADQVLARISPHVGVSAEDADADPLSRFLATTVSIAARFPDDALVCPGHGLPFHGVGARCEELVLHHFDRCKRVLDACRGGALPATGLVPLLFDGGVDADALPLAIGETLAHANFLVARGLLGTSSRDGVRYYETSACDSELSAVFTDLREDAPAERKAL